MNFRIYIKKRLLDGTWSDPLCIQDSFMGIKEEMLVDPTLTKKKSSAGSFEAGVHFDNIALQTTDPKGQPWLEKGNTRIFIKAFKDKYDMPGLVTGTSMIPDEQDKGQIIWDGRILSCDTDFYNQPKIHAEGSLSFLGDVILPKMVFKCKTNDSQVDTDVYKYVEKPCYIFREIIAAHNAKDTSHADDIRNDYIESIRFVANTKADANGNTYGSIWPDSWVKEDTVEGGEGKQATTLSIGDETTQSALTKLLNAFGGGIRVTWKWTYDEESSWDAKWVRYIEWITEDYDIQKEKDPSMVQFSANLLDMTRKTDASSVATYIMPRGYKAYSGGNWAIGDDMFAPVEEEYPRGAGSGSLPKEIRTVTRTTWTSGCYIVKDNAAGAKYVWAPDPDPSTPGIGGGQWEETMATGYLNAGGPYDPNMVPGTYPILFREDGQDPVSYTDNPNDPGSGSVWDADRNGYLRGHALEVLFGETYYISLEQSEGRVTYVVTAGPLGHNGSVVLDIGTASSAYWPADSNAREYTKWDHHKLEIKRPTGKFKMNNETYDYDTWLVGKKIYLNISSRGWYFDQSGQGENLVKNNAWKSWSGGVPYWDDLHGHHNGDDPNMLGPAGIWKGRKIPEGLDEYITLKGLGDGSYSAYFYNITVTTSDANGTTSTSKEIVIDCPEQKQISRTEPGGVNGEFGYPYDDPLKRRGIVATVSDLPDPTTVVTGAWYEVTAENNKKYVTVQTSTGVNRWYPQRTFVRDGYYVYDPEAVKHYGRIEKIVDMSDVHNPSYLEAAAAQTLYNAKFEAYSLDMSAIDAQLLTEDAQLSKVLDVMDPVYVRSAYHGVSVMLPIEELELPFNDLGSMSYSLSFTTTQRITSNISTKKR